MIRDRISHLDFDLVCSVSEHKLVREARLFGLIPEKYRLDKCQGDAEFLGVSQCCDQEIFLCRSHCEDDWCWMCPLCRNVSLSLSRGISISPL